MNMNIHSPSLSSARSTNQEAPSYANGSSTKDKLLQVMKEKDVLEEELKALGRVLDSHGVNMNTPLITFDGFPRDDIDVPQIRITRSRIIHLRNDYKALMSQIETLLHKYHSELQQENEGETVGVAPTTTLTQHTHLPLAAPAPSSSSSSPSIDRARDQVLIDVPFAMVDQVFPSSPAETAGLKIGDALVRFGEVHALNHNKLAKVAEVVGQNEGVPIVVLIKRKKEGGDGTNGDEDMETLSINLVPSGGWGGRGLLGCHLRPL